MEYLTTFLDFFLHIDEQLSVILRDYGAWTYAILFVIIFCETGLVVTPFLPGDSLLFATGALAAGGGIHPVPILVLLSAAAILGDTVNYMIGSIVGVRAFREGNRFLKPEYLARTEAFYRKHGGKTIVLARFVPIVRTYAPFVAGAGRMPYTEFIIYNVTGGLLWIVLFVMGGYLFGNIPVVQENFEIVILMIVFLSIVPMIVEYLKHRRRGPAEEG